MNTEMMKDLAEAVIKNAAYNASLGGEEEFVASEVWRELRFELQAIRIDRIQRHQMQDIRFSFTL